MISKDVSRGVAGSVGMLGLAGSAVLGNVAMLPKESRIKFVKSVVFVVIAFLAAVSAVISLGLFSELSTIPATEKGLAMFCVIAFALPAVGVFAFVLKKLIRK